MSADLSQTEDDTKLISLETKQISLDVQDGCVDVTSEKDGGIVKTVRIEGHGSGTPVTGDSASILYVAKLSDGTVVDSSGEEPLEFTMGDGPHNKSFDLAVSTMKRGEQATFKIASNYAFGEKGRPPEVPPNSLIIFEVELLDFKGQDISDEGDGSILRSVLKFGRGVGSPNDGAMCEIEYVGRCNDVVFEDRAVSFPIGEGSEFGIIEGLEIALKRFSLGEKSRLKIASRLAYGTKGCKAFSIPPNQDLVYEVELRECNRTKEFFDMSLEEKVEQSVVAKEKGNEYFKAGKTNLALMFYQRTVEYLQFEDNAKEQHTAILLAAYLNVALCQLKLENFKDAVENCDKALLLDPGCEKALFRRGQANHSLNNFEAAVKDFRALLNLNPDNRTARFQLSICERTMWDYRQKEKKIYSMMFQNPSEGEQTSVCTSDCQKSETNTDSV